MIRLVSELFRFGSGKVLRAASIDMIKVRQRELIKVDGLWRKLESEIAEVIMLCSDVLNHAKCNFVVTGRRLLYSRSCHAWLEVQAEHCS